MAIDKVLSKPIEAGLVPGVVAVAAGDSGVIYEGAFGRRAVGSTEPMTLELCVSDCIDDQGHHRHGGDTAGRKGPYRSRTTDGRRIAIGTGCESAGGLRMEMARLDCVIPKRRSRSGTC